jgi:hypothetical protein
VVQGLPASGRARPRRDGGSVWRRNVRPRLGRAAGLLQMRWPRNRYGRDRDEAALKAAHRKYRQWPRERNLGRCTLNGGLFAGTYSTGGIGSAVARTFLMTFIFKPGCVLAWPKLALRQFFRRAPTVDASVTMSPATAGRVDPRAVDTNSTRHPHSNRLRVGNPSDSRPSQHGGISALISVRLRPGP